MKLTDIKKEVTKAYNSELKQLEVKGYVDSKGKKHNYTVCLLGSDGYTELIQQSLEKLPNTTLDAVVGVADEVRWEEEGAKLELMASFKKTLEGKQVKRALSDPPVPTADGYSVYASDARKDFIAITPLREIAHEVVGGKTASRVGQPKVEAKKKLREQLPISKYIHTLILGVGKVDSVRAL